MIMYGTLHQFQTVSDFFLFHIQKIKHQNNFPLFYGKFFQRHADPLVTGRNLPAHNSKIICHIIIVTARQSLRGFLQKFRKDHFPRSLPIQFIKIIQCLTMQNFNAIRAKFSPHDFFFLTVQFQNMHTVHQ